MRGTAAVVLALLACLLLPVALVAGWTEQRLTSEDGYVAATGPLASDPVVRREVGRRLVRLVERSVPGEIGDLVPGAGALGDTVVRPAVAGVLRSELFRRTWVRANRSAHGQLVDVLRGERDGGRVTLDLAPVLRSVVDELAGHGLPVSDLPGDTTITIAGGPELDRAGRVYRVVDEIGYRGAVAWAVLVALALLVARSRLRIAAVVAWTSLLTAGATLLALEAARRAGVAAVPAADRDLVRAGADVLTSSLQRALVVVVVAAAVVGVLLLVVVLVRGSTGGRARRA